MVTVIPLAMLSLGADPDPTVGGLLLVVWDRVGLEVAAFSAGSCAGETLDDLVSLLGLLFPLRLVVDPDPVEFVSGDVITLGSSLSVRNFVGGVIGVSGCCRALTSTSI